MTTEIQIAERSFRPAEMRSSSLNEAARTVEVIWSTGAPVKRYSWDEGYYMEELSMDPLAVDLARLNAGASFLDTHGQSSMADRLGAVVPGSARLENGKGVATIVLSTSKAGEQVLSDLRAGLPLPISVGYRVSAYSKNEVEEGALPTFTATRWEPMEISAVPVPADPGAQSRSAEGHAAKTHVPVVNAGRAKGSAGPLEVQLTTPHTETIDTRADDILGLAQRFGASARLARKAIDGGKTLAEFRSMVIDEKIAEQEKTPTFSVAPMHGERGQELPLSEALADGVMCRLDPSHKASEAGRQYAGLSVAELARTALHARGESTRAMSAGQLVERALHTTSDFPLALQLVGHRQLTAAYEAAPAEIKKVARKGTNRDFRPKANVALSEAGGLLKVNEHGEYKRATFTEGLEQYALESFGRIFGITRQALINDDLGVFADMPGRFGRMATEFEAGYIAKLIERNPRMGDGLAVFHADHRNLAATGAALSVASLSAARLAMRRQVGIDAELISVAPRYLVIPPELETLAEQLLAAIAAAKADDVKPVRLELLVEPRLTDPKAWYLAADPAAFPAVEYAHLEGQSGPRLDQRVGFDVDGVEYKVALDFGAAILDHRGLFKNPGV